MKRIVLLAAALMSVMILPAQGIYQMWGTTFAGGIDDLGVIYSMDAKAGHFRVRHEFEISAKGAQPKYTQLTEYNGDFYGLTSAGGRYDAGVIFKWNPVTNAYRKLVDFYDSIGKSPHGSLALFENKLYGMTTRGGSLEEGVIFEYDPSTNLCLKKQDFDWNRGVEPYGSLSLKGSKFYGMTSTAVGGLGTIFEWDPRTNVFEKKNNI